MVLSKNKIILIIGIGFGSVFLWLSLRDIQFSVLLDTILHQVNYWYAIPFIALYLGFFWIKAIRWTFLLKPFCNTSAARLFPAIMIGYAGNIIFPAQLGEFIRAYISSHQLRIKAMPILATIFLERIFDLLTLLLLLVSVVLFSGKDYPTLIKVCYFMGAIALVGFSVTVGFLFFARPVLGFFRLASSCLPSHLQQKIMQQLERISEGLQSMRQPGLLFRVMLSSLLMWSMMIGATYLSLLAVENLQVPFSAGVVVLAVSVAGLALPTSPGFVGTIQYSFVLALSAYGISHDQAVAASVLYHALITIPPLLIGLYYFARSGYKTRQMQEEVIHYEE